MLRILHTSDWHLGHTLHDLSRWREHDAFLAWLMDLLGEAEIDALLVTGDIFDSANPPAAASSRWFSFLARLRARYPRLDVVVIGGNHDSAARLDAPRPILESMNIHILGGLPRTAEGQAGPRPDHPAAARCLGRGGRVDRRRSLPPPRRSAARGGDGRGHRGGAAHRRDAGAVWAGHRRPAGAAGSGTGGPADGALPDAGRDPVRAERAQDPGRQPGRPAGGCVPRRRGLRGAGAPAHAAGGGAGHRPLRRRPPAAVDGRGGVRPPGARPAHRGGGGGAPGVAPRPAAGGAPAPPGGGAGADRGRAGAHQDAAGAGRRTWTRSCCRFWRCG